MYLVCIQKHQGVTIICNSLICKWAHLGLNQGPLDYESSALTN